MEVCEAFYHADPKEIRWLVKHKTLGPINTIIKFNDHFPKSHFMLHCLYSSCRYCEEKLKVLVGLKDSWGNSIENGD